MTDRDEVLDLAMSLDGARRYENYVAAICPFHEDNKPSLLVHQDRYHCVACGAKGWTDTLLERVALRPARQRKASYYPHIPEMPAEDFVAAAHRHLSRHPEYQEYLEKRGLGNVIRRYKLGYWDGWYVVPSFSKSGDLKDTIFRAGKWVQEQTGERFFQRAGQKPGMYVPDWKKEGTTLFVCFGLFDAMTVSMLGFPAATPSMGKGGIKPEWLGWWPYRIVILPDVGEEKEANILAAGLDWRGRVHKLNYPEGCKDPNDYLQKDQEALNRELYGLVSNQSDRYGAGTARQARPQCSRFAGAGSAV